MAPFKLTKFQRKKILDLRKKNRDSLIYRRLCALLWLDEGKTVDEVAGLLDVDTRTVENWVKLYLDKGAKSICTFDHKGDPGKLNDDQKKNL